MTHPNGNKNSADSTKLLCMLLRGAIVTLSVEWDSKFVFVASRLIGFILKLLGAVSRASERLLELILTSEA
jgi:hypothetical protein